MTPTSLAAAASGPAAPSTPAPGSGFGAVLEARSMRLPAAGAPAGSSIPGGALAAARDALASLERARERLDRLLDGGRAGRTCTARELLAVQREAYGYAQRVELAAKVVEQGAQTVKQAVGTQV
ncbi:hypothetical protein [Anaeromyxobacter paludicola]|uniref:Uncharacterized protein n=1 Tax=Anaeromyxobacter paludicola TaxID=2918171 RepID=A0ABM7XAS0_9BACT|nr:hypothetical protein [Anaeromyxobacter paludicola]BDG08941.1 hypothetical protein AMPC_20540 [Anaeromyxobacter paludicola]